MTCTLPYLAHNDCSLEQLQMDAGSMYVAGITVFMAMWIVYIVVTAIRERM